MFCLEKMEKSFYIEKKEEAFMQNCLVIFDRQFSSILNRLWLVFVIMSLFGITGATSAEADREAKQHVLSETNSEVLQRMAQELRHETGQNRKRAVAVARAKGWTIREELPNGKTIEIQRLGPDGEPLYYVTHNLNAADTISTNEVWSGGGSGLALTGSGLTIGEWDAGAVRTTHQEFGGRVTQQDSSGSTHWHSTHVAGTLIAGGVVAASKGMAPQALLYAYDWNSDGSEMAAAAAEGVLVSKHSYGYLAGWAYGTYDGANTGYYWWGDTRADQDEDYKFGYYGTYPQSWDTIAVNAPYYLIVKSAGNDRGNTCPDPTTGHYYYDFDTTSWTYSEYNRQNKDGGTSGYDTIPIIGIAKNIVTVGSVGDIVGGYSQPSDVGISSYSGWGPTDDGRIKPDICANGASLYSTSSGADDSYTRSSGTSMSTPSAAGSLALLQEHYDNLYGRYMRSATLKALALHTADEVGSHVGPDYMCGWGLMNTATAVGIISEKDTGTLIEEDTLYDGATYTLDLFSSGSSPLTVTLAWTDPAGTPPSISLDPSDPILVNDLDMRITKDAATYSPWILDPASPSAAATTGDNSRDNVEQIDIASPVSGKYTLTITHKNTLDSSAPQPFSLVVSGIVAEVELTYTGTSFEESPANDGTLVTRIPILLTGDTFQGSNDDDFVGSRVLATVDGSDALPLGLTVEVIRKADDELEARFTSAAASSHANANDISNLRFQFLDSAFTNSNASDVANADRSDLLVDFHDMPAGFMTDVGTLSISSPLTADFDTDGDLEIIVSSGMTLKLFPANAADDPIPATAAVDPLGTYTSGLGSFGTSPLLADVDDDGRSEIIAIDTLGNVHVVDVVGSPASSLSGAFTFNDSAITNVSQLATPAIGDVNGSGGLDIAWSGDNGSGTAALTVFDLSAKSVV